MAKRRMPPPVAASEEDIELFRNAIGPVREIVAAPAPPPAPRPAPLPRQRDADEAEALLQSRLRPFDFADAALGDAMEHLADGLPPRLLRQLRRGQFSVQDELDLHSMSAQGADQAVRRFLNECALAGARCVRIIHGKGLRSGDEGPVLKRLVDHLLRQRADVMAFASAPAAQGGTGAVLVLLARRRAGAAPLSDADR